MKQNSLVDDFKLILHTITPTAKAYVYESEPSEKKVYLLMLYGDAPKGSNNDNELATDYLYQIADKYHKELCMLSMSLEEWQQFNKLAEFYAHIVDNGVVLQ